MQEHVQYVDGLGRVQPWEVHYDDFGRMIVRADYNAGNAVEGYESTHYHTYGYRGNPSGVGLNGELRQVTL